MTLSTMAALQPCLVASQACREKVLGAPSKIVQGSPQRCTGAAGSGKGNEVSGRPAPQ